MSGDTGLENALSGLAELASRAGIPAVGRHLRYPARVRSTLLGSELGAELWETGQGRTVELALLTKMLAIQEPIAPSEEFALIELHGRVGTFVDLALLSGDIGGFVATHTETLVMELTEPPSAESVWLWAGVAVGPARLDIPPAFV